MKPGNALRAAAFLVALLVGGVGAAHEMSIAEMELRELSRGDFTWQWTASGSRPASAELTLRWPAGCAPGDATLRCGEQGLRGTLTIEGVCKRYSAALVKIHWSDGIATVHTLTAAQPSVRLFGSSRDDRDAREIAYAYTVLGVEHILGGPDHVMFVLGLVFLVGFQRRLVWTITAFTAAHSVTLALSALGWLLLRPPPVEATIALSIMLVAGEALHSRQTWSRRWPAIVAFLFGLFHGLGFAGALKEVGLPDDHLPLALLTFNAGVEAGQLAIVAVAYVVHRAMLRVPGAQWLRRPALYTIGSVAAYWSIGRIAAIVS